MFQTVYFDHLFQSSMYSIGVKEGWITHRADGLQRWEISKHDVLTRNNLKSKTLLRLALFENIDGTTSEFNLNKFVDSGIVAKNSNTLDIHERVEMKDTFYAELKELAIDTAIHVLEMATKSVISSHMHLSPMNYYKKINGYRNRQNPNAPFDLPTNFPRTEWGVLDQNDLIMELTRVLPSIKQHQEIHPEHKKAVIPGGFYDYINHIVWSTQEGVFYSLINDGCMASGFSNSSPKKVENTDIVDDLYYMVRAKIPVEDIILPAPGNLSDVMAIRESNHIERFREVLTEWCAALQQGDNLTQQKITNDILLASKDLKKAGAWRQYRQSPIDFWLNSIGGHVPIFSNILTAVNSAGEIYSKAREKRSGWRMLTQ